MNKYTIDGEKAGTYTSLSTPLLRVLETQTVVTIHNGKQYIFNYIDLPQVFDITDTKSVRDHIFRSIKWIS